MKTFKIKHYRIKIKQTISSIVVCSFILFTISVAIVTDFKFNERIYFPLLSLFIVMSIVVIFPSIIRRHYYRYDKDTILEIDEEKQVISYKHRGKHLKAAYNEIEKIYCISFPRTEAAPYYYRIFLKSGQSIIITSLVVENLEGLGFKTYDIHTYNLFLPKKFIYK